VEEELKTLLRLRKCDTVFISGGEPLVHPQLEEIVQMVKAHGVKPVLVSNGYSLNKKRVRELKKAGLFGFILHVDRGLSRPGWIGKSEKELNKLRQHYADMIHAEKKLICGFNTTILPESLHEVPDIGEWTMQNIHTVCTNTFIPVRVPREDDPWDLYVGGEKIDFQETVFSSKKYKNPSNTNLTAEDIFTQIQKVVPGYRANAFLGGTEVSVAPKWLFSNIIGTDKKIFGNMGPKTIEIFQNGYHLLKGRFLSFLKPGFYARAKLLFLFGAIDGEMRTTFFSFLRTLIKNPLRLFKKVIEKGREVIFVAGRNNNKLVTHPGGVLQFMTFHLDPEGDMAMKRNRHSLQHSGMEKVMHLIQSNVQRASEIGLDTIEYVDEDRIAGRDVWIVEGNFPANQGFYAHREIIAIDKSMMLPVSVSIFDRFEGLVEVYVFRDLKINVGFNESDFDPDNPDYNYF
jgi:hypothetical protein